MGNARHDEGRAIERLMDTDQRKVRPAGLEDIHRKFQLSVVR